MVAHNYRRLAEVMRKVCDEQTIADLMNDFLSCDADERLNAYDVMHGEAFFDALTDVCPETVDVAQGLRPAGTH